MDDNTSYTMKLMLLWRTLNMSRLHTPGGMRNDSWRVPVSFLTTSDHKGARKPTVDAQMSLWGAVAVGGWNCLKTCNVGEGVFSC